jgi:hypothetical protein
MEPPPEPATDHAATPEEGWTVILSPGCTTGLEIEEYPTYRGRTLCQPRYPRRGDLVNIRLHDDIIFTEIKVIDIIKRMFKKGYHTNIQVVAGKAKTSRKKDFSFQFHPGKDDWDLPEEGEVQHYAAAGPRRTRNKR